MCIRDRLGPGRELLMTRPWEACRFTQDAFELEYRPRPHTEEKDYERVMYRMLYADIRRVEYDSSCERLLVFGRHTVARYYTCLLYTSLCLSLQEEQVDA